MSIEYYVANCTLTPSLETTLKEVVQSSYLPNRETCRHHLERAGFADICFIDLTTGWKAWVKERYEKFLSSKEESIKVFGKEVYEHRSQFYQTINDLFQSGYIGGSLITAKKPCALKINQVPETYFSSVTSTYSEQYHFFLEDGSLIALRHFKTATLEHYSAWWSDKEGYHFVYAFFPDYGILWSADATFGQEKYNYFKLLKTSQTEKEILLQGEYSYHRQTSAHARIENKTCNLKFDTKTLATWSSILRNQTSTMESNLCLEYKPAILEIEDEQVREGICLKESCFGTIA